MSKLEAFARAYDKEDASQRGEPDPWLDGKDDAEWVSERLACAAAALASLPEAPAAGVVTEEMIDAYKAAFSKAVNEALIADTAEPAFSRNATRAGLAAALLSSPPVQTAAVDGEAVKAASAAVLDILNTAAIVHPKEPSAKRLAERIACAALASQAAGEGAAEPAWGPAIRRSVAGSHASVVNVNIPARPSAPDAGVREWHPIETAPTNKAILIHVPNLDYYGNDGVYAGMLVDMGTGRRWMTFGWAIGRDLGEENVPVAWREIPTASPLSLAAKRGQAE
jgi:hypothetical protein